MSEAENFQKSLGAELAEQLGQGYKFLRSKLELRQKGNESSNVVVLAGSNKYSPEISISFYFGRHFEALKKVEKALGLEPMSYHIQQYSPNLQNMANHPNASGQHTWRVNINQTSEELAKTIAAAINKVSEPFFNRFSTIEDSRNAIAGKDSWCFSGPALWRSLFLFDAALGDIEHFKKWSECLKNYEKQQAEQLVARYYEI